jgi:hypothetical protein
MARVVRIMLAPVRRIRGSALVKQLRASRRFKRDFSKMTALVDSSQDRRFRLAWPERMPVLNEDTSTTAFDAHYVYHTSWAARLLSRNPPPLHHDFGSDIRFATLVSAFVPIVFHDFRPLLVELSNLESRRADLLDMDLESNSVRSLSCMHVVEHIGLGRYGDRIDPQGDLKAISELKRILAVSGNLYFVVPLGKPFLRFNAHRIYSFAMVREYFSEYALLDFSLVTDDGRFVASADPGLADGQRYGCGCFWFKKQHSGDHG